MKYAIKSKRYTDHEFITLCVFNTLEKANRAFDILMKSKLKDRCYAVRTIDIPMLLDGELN